MTAERSNSASKLATALNQKARHLGDFDRFQLFLRQTPNGVGLLGY